MSYSASKRTFRSFDSCNMQWGNSKYKTLKEWLRVHLVGYSYKASEIPCRLSNEISHIRRRIAPSGAFANSLKIESITPTRILEIVELFKRNAIQWLSYSDTLTLQQLHAKYFVVELHTNTGMLPHCRNGFWIGRNFFSHFSSSAQTKINTIPIRLNQFKHLLTSLEVCIEWKRKKKSPTDVID